MGVFGPVVYTRTYPEGVADGAVVPIKIQWIKLPRPDNWPENGFRQRNAYYRHGVWRNRDMHRVVGELCAKIPPEWQHLIIVDKIEHMNALLGHMPPGYSAVHAETSQTKLDESGFANVRALSFKDRGKVYQRIAAGEVKKVISTGVYRQGVNFTELTVVINGEGMGSAIMAGQIPGRASRSVDGKSCAYIIDFWHDWDMVDDDRGRKVPGSLLRDDKSREKVYTALGFNQVWVDPGSVNFQ
jgi:superfamily II DNA or RNA helicase